MNLRSKKCIILFFGGLIFARVFAASPFEWVADKSEDLSFDKTERVNLLEGDPVFSAIASAAIGRTPSLDSKFAIRKEHWRLNPGMSIGGALSQFSSIVLPVGIGLDVERGVSFYRRYDPQLHKSILSMPLNPLNHIPRSAYDIREKVPPGTIVHIPARTQVNFGKGYALSVLSEALKDTLDIVTLRDLVSASAGFSVGAKYDLLVSRSHEDPNIARVQLIASKDESFTAGISTGMKFLLGESQGTGNKYGDKASQKGISKITGKFLGQPIQLDFIQSGEGVQTVFDYSYDLRKPEALQALDQALKAAGPIRDLSIMRKASASGPSSVIHDIFSPAFESSENLLANSDSGVYKNANISTETAHKNAGWRLGLNALFRLGENSSKSNTLAHSGNDDHLILKETRSSTTQGPFGIGRENAHEDLSSYYGYDPSGNIIDGYVETVFKYDFSDKNINEESVNRLATYLRSRLGPDLIVFGHDMARPGTTATGLTEFLERMRVASKKGPGQLHKGQFQLEFRISPTYLFLTRNDLKRGALANQCFDQVSQHAYISNWVAYRMKIVAARLGFSGILATSQQCIDWVSKTIGLFFLLKDPQAPHFIHPNIEHYRNNIPIGCKKTYDFLALPTIIDFVNDQVEDPRFGPKFDVFAQIEGKAKPMARGEKDADHYESIGQYQWVRTPLENRIGQVISLQGQSLDPLAAFQNNRVPGNVPVEFVPTTESPENMEHTLGTSRTAK